MSGNASHIARSVVVDYAPQRTPGGGIDFGRRDAWEHRGWRLEHGILHPQRLKNIQAGELGEHLAAQPAHDLAHKNEIYVAINEADTRRTGGLIDQSAVDSGLIPAPGGLQIEIGPQSREVGHQVA